MESWQLLCAAQLLLLLVLRLSHYFYSDSPLTITSATTLPSSRHKLLLTRRGSSTSWIASTESFGKNYTALGRFLLVRGPDTKCEQARQDVGASLGNRQQFFRACQESRIHLNVEKSTVGMLRLPFRSEILQAEFWGLHCTDPNAQGFWALFPIAEVVHSFCVNMLTHM